MARRPVLMCPGNRAKRKRCPDLGLPGGTDVSECIYVGADHAGYELKEQLKVSLEGRDLEVVDVGTDGPDSVDYPDFAIPVAEAVSCGRAPYGLLICGTGVGMSMTANKFPGVRAALCGDTYTARMSREHNDANILVLAARVVDYTMAPRILETWLDTPFGGERHARRVGKVRDLEDRLAREGPCAR